MIAKINKSTMLFGALSYNMEKVKSSQASILCVNEIWEKEKYYMHDFLRAFQARLLCNKRTKTPIVHISLNPDPKDVLSDDQMAQIAKEYLVQMGYGEQPFVVFKHTDIARSHMHILTTSIDKQGKKISDSNEYYKSQRITRNLELTYGLHKLKERKREQGYVPDKVDFLQGEYRYQIKNITADLVKSYYFSSIREYKALLSLHGIAMEEVKGAHNAKAYYGLMYSVLNAEGKKGCAPIKSSQIAPHTGARFLEEKIQKDAVIYKRKLMASAESISKVLEQATSMQALQEDLQKQNMSCICYYNAANRLYGITYVDRNNGIVAHGSSLGKRFSASALHRHFVQEQPLPALVVGQAPRSAIIELPSAHLSVQGSGTAFKGGSSQTASLEKKKRKRKKNTL